MANVERFSLVLKSSRAFVFCARCAYGCPPSIRLLTSILFRRCAGSNPLGVRYTPPFPFKLGLVLLPGPLKERTGKDGRRAASAWVIACGSRYDDDGDSDDESGNTWLEIIGGL